MFNKGRIILFLSVLLIVTAFVDVLFAQAVQAQDIGLSDITQVIRDLTVHKTEVIVDGKQYQIITLKEHIDPKTFERKPTEKPYFKIYVDSYGNPVSDHSIAQKIGLIEHAESVFAGSGSIKNLSSSIDDMKDRIDLHNRIRFLEMLKGVSSSAISTAIRAYMTGLTTIPADILKSIASIVTKNLLTVQNFAELLVADDFREAISSYKQAIQIAETKDLRNYNNAYQYLSNYYRGANSYYPARHLIDNIDKISKRLVEEFSEFFGKIADKVALEGLLERVKHVFDELKTTKPIAEYIKEGIEWANRSELVLNKMDFYTAQYTIELAENIAKQRKLVEIKIKGYSLPSSADIAKFSDISKPTDSLTGSQTKSNEDTKITFSSQPPRTWSGGFIARINSPSPWGLWRGIGNNVYIGDTWSSNFGGSDATFKISPDGSQYPYRLFYSCATCISDANNMWGLDMSFGSFIQYMPEKDFFRVVLKDSVPDSNTNRSRFEGYYGIQTLSKDLPTSGRSKYDLFERSVSPYTNVTYANQKVIDGQWLQNETDPNYAMHMEINWETGKVYGIAANGPYPFSGADLFIGTVDRQNSKVVGNYLAKKFNFPSDFIYSGNPFDLTIKGDGYFMVTKPDGNIAYTRDGTFKLDIDGRVVNSNGYPLDALQIQGGQAGRFGGAITIPADATKITISRDGVVTVFQTGSTTPVEIGAIWIARFVNPSGLQAIGDNLFIETTASGAAIIGEPGTSGRGFIEQGFPVSFQFYGTNSPKGIAGIFNMNWYFENNKPSPSYHSLIGFVDEPVMTPSITGYSYNPVDNEIWKGYAVGLVFNRSDGSLNVAANTNPDDVQMTFLPSQGKFKGSITTHSGGDSWSLTTDYNDRNVYVSQKALGAVKDVNGVPAYIATSTSSFEPYNYLTWGYWSYDEVSTNTIFAKSPWIAGQLTPANEIPITGTATYNGGVWGWLREPLVGGFKFLSVTGTSSLIANFGNRTLTGSFDFNKRGDTGGAWTTANVNASWASGTNNISGTLNAANGMTGNVSGAFFGPQAAEIGGNWTLQGGGNQAAGVFKGKK
jgi:hypothetical protein